MLRGNEEIRLDLALVKEQTIINLDSCEDIINKAEQGDRYCV